jgi:hypothetical protein
MEMEDVQIDKYRMKADENEPILLRARLAAKKAC